MFDWVNGRPPILLRANDVKGWPGAYLKPDPTLWARVAPYRGSAALVLRGAHLTTAIPLELGGLLLVSAVYCDSDDALSAHLDLMPTVGWELCPARFESDGSGHALLDGSHTGSELEGDAATDEIAAESGGVIPVSLPAGTYDVEALGPWSPDDRTELWLTRLVRTAPPPQS